MAEDEILIIHAGGTTRATTLSLVLSAKFATGIAIRPPALELLTPDIAVFNPKKLGRLSDVVSVISGQHAVIYKRGKLEIAVTPNELIRMTMGDLRPSEVKTLRDRFGDIDELPQPSPEAPGTSPKRSRGLRGFFERIRDKRSKTA